MRTYASFTALFASLATGIGLAAAGPTPAAAQTSAGDAAAYVALLSTPNAGLPPLVTGTMLGARQNGAQFVVRYGHVGVSVVGTLSNVGDAANSLGATAILPVGTTSTVSLTAGFERPSCDGCDAPNSLILSVGGDMPLTSWPMGQGRDADRLTMTLAGELGFGKPQDDRALAGTVSVPFALSLGSGGEGMRITPFLTPGFGFASYQFSVASPAAFGVGGSSRSTETESGTRFLLGGGVALWNPTSTVSVSAGFQHVFIDNGTTLYGLTLTLGGGR